MTTPSPCDSRLADCRCAGDHPPHHTHRCAVPGCAARWDRRGEVVRLPTSSMLTVIREMSAAVAA